MLIILYIFACEPFYQTYYFRVVIIWMPFSGDTYLLDGETLTTNDLSFIVQNNLKI